MSKSHAIEPEYLERAERTIAAHEAVLDLRRARSANRQGIRFDMALALVHGLAGRSGAVMGSVLARRGILPDGRAAELPLVCLPQKAYDDSIGAVFRRRSNVNPSFPISQQSAKPMGSFKLDQADRNNGSLTAK